MNLEATIAAKATEALPSKRSPRCVLDSPESKALLAKHGIQLSEKQMAMFREVENHWDVEVFNPDTAGCLINGRFDQAAVDGYFVAITAIWEEGREAPVEQIVQILSKLFPEGVAFVLYAAAKCMVFSDAIAHEAYRQLMLSKIDKRRSRPRSAIREYRDRIAHAEGLVQRAARAR